MTSTTQPKLLTRSLQRSPNLPAVSTKTLSPGEVRFETDPSITPVPEEDSTKTSLLVPMNSFISASTRENKARNSAVRWCIAADAMAVWAAGSIGVGPGVKRRFLRNIPISPENQVIRLFSSLSEHQRVLKCSARCLTKGQGRG